MKRWHNFTLSIIVLLSLGFVETVAVSQTKPNTTGTAKKSPSVAARTLPTIKCTDPDSMVACKSFKQLVDARDKDLLDSLTGDKESKQRHFAYACLRPKDDAFEVIEFDEPLPAQYRPHSSLDYGNNLVSTLQKLRAFPYIEGKPNTHLIEAQSKWYEDHDDFYVYDFGAVEVDSWRNGILSDYISDSGKWRKLAAQGNSSSNEDATFESAHQWLADFDEASANQLASADDREKPRISVDDTSIAVRYSFKNQNNDYTDYRLNIQRSTGRFIESFETTGIEPFENSGICMMFKQ